MNDEHGKVLIPQATPGIPASMRRAPLHLLNVKSISNMEVFGSQLTAMTLLVHNSKAEPAILDIVII